mgnify:CR=1 FL=1
MSLFEGVMAASVTPLRADSYEPNLAAFLESVDFLCKYPLAGIVVLGSTGDMVHFDLPERIKILEFARKRAALPVIAGVTHSTLEGTVEPAQHAVQIGCDGLLVMPPYYFREVARRVGVKVPILAYHIPAYTNPIALDTVWQLVEEGAISGVKDSSGEASRMEWLIEKRSMRPFYLLSGADRLLQEVWRHPGIGCISGIACAVPELYLAFHGSMQRANEAHSARLDGYVQEFCNWFDEFPNASVVKAAMSLRRRIAIPPAVPLSFERQQKMAEFQAWFEAWLPGVLEACASES